jgi:isoleucyl-tRNA synthetase
MADKYNELASQLADILIVSGVSVASDAADETTYEVVKASGDKCERCWCYSETVGKNADHPTLCERCASVIK